MVIMELVLLMDDGDNDGITTVTVEGRSYEGNGIYEMAW